jgi:hypothetical protein
VRCMLYDVFSEKMTTYKSVVLTEENWRRVKEKGTMDDSMNDVIGRLLDFWESKHK